MVVRTVVQRGPKEKKVAAFAIDWPGWSRGAKTPDAAVEMLEAYRERYRPIARLAGLESEFDRAGPLEIVEDHVGVGSTDFWGISFAPSSFEQAPMPDDELERKLALLEASWRFFDDVAARVSPELREGPARRRSQSRRDRPPRPRQRVGDLARKVGVIAPPGELPTPEASVRTARSIVAAMRDYNAEGKMARGRNWTIALLVRHTAFHALDHAWEMEDKDLSYGLRGAAARESARGSAPPSYEPSGRRRITWAQPISGVFGSTSETSWPSASSAATVAASTPSDSMLTGPSGSAGPSVEPPSAAGPPAPADPARRPRGPVTSWTIVCGCPSPPIAPNATSATPSRSSMPGMSVCSVRERGASAFGWLGIEARSRHRGSGA